MRIRVLAVTVLFAACNRGESGGNAARTPDTTQMTSSSSTGDVQLTDGSHLSFAITSDRYRQWDAAQRAIAPDVAARFGKLLNPAAPTEASISRAVAFLESNAGARQAITAAGMNVRDFVSMTVMLEQQMQASKTADAMSPPPLFPEIPTTAPVDTTPMLPPAPYTPPPQPTPAYVVPVPTPDTMRARFTRDSVLARARADSIIRYRTDSILRDGNARARATLKRDSTPARDTTVKRDTMPVRRDTTRDTTRTAPVTLPSR